MEENGNRDAWRYIFSGTQLAVSVLLGVFVGIWMDKRFHVRPWLTVAGSLLGIGAGLYNFLKDFTQTPPNGKKQ